MQSRLPMLFGGFPVVISDHLPTTKTVTWRTERKWCHWKTRSALRFRMNSKQVPCETVLMFNGSVVMSSDAWAKVEVQLASQRHAV